MTASATPAHDPHTRSSSTSLSSSQNLALRGHVEHPERPAGQPVHGRFRSHRGLAVASALTQAISSEIAALYALVYGHDRTTATTYINDNVVLCVLENSSPSTRQR